MPQALQVMGAVANVAGTIGTMNARKRATAERKHAAQLQARRERRQMIRQSIIARAEVQAAGQGLGASGSSALSGGVGSIASQTGGNLGFATQMSAIGANISSAQEQASMSSGIASIGGGLFQLGGSMPQKGK